ncbi:hypothetical protein FA13DRAFT_1478392 [Coprinellus micaceus]|uniref:RNI-like protein n=1 Tax=Coprinellus micaceus TaxID=71717 RepID=A0A4Y7SMT9_COPMI|nr:hypothetical protein FA13DRAFT_1478392 [Coprinellus micaceus]
MTTFREQISRPHLGGGPRIRAENLRSIAFQSLVGAQWPLLLKKIDTPNLERMCITSNVLNFEHWAGAQAAIDSFLVGLAALQQLTYISINSSGASPADLHSILEATRGVNTLDLAVSDVGTILQALALPNLAPAQGTLPHLRTIIIEDLTGFDPSPFLSFLTFRRQYPPEPAAEGRLILP